MERRRLHGLVLIVFLGVCQASTAQPNVPRLDFTDQRLENGLRVIIAPDHSAPLFSIAITYNVGSRNERPGRTGFAHLFEHMMFEGSENVGKGEHVILVSNNGGGMNATTDEDRTNYFEELPKNQLDLALFLEADRMHALQVNQANLDNQRNAVEEERRQGIDNQPYGKSELELDNLSYDNFAYKHSTIGSMADLDAAGVDDVKDFFRTYYSPNNAVLTLVGDLEPAETLAKVKKYFDAISPQPEPPRVDLTEPEHKGERREVVYDPLARLPQVMISYHIPPGDTVENFALQVLGDVLATGISSRLYQRLVKGRQLATSIEIDPDARIGPGLFYITATPRPGVRPEELETAIYAEIEAVQKDGVTALEIEKARTQYLRSQIQSRQSCLSTAVRLGEYAVFFDDPGLINTIFLKYAAITAEQIRTTAEKYLLASNRAVVTTLPARLLAVADRTGTITQAQELGGNKSETASEVRRLNRAPVNTEVLQVKLPRPRVTKLANGLTVLVLEQHKLPIVALTLWVKTGALADPKELPGLAKASAEMLREGTTHRTSAQLAADVDRMGASLGSSAEFGSDISTVSASGLSENTDRLLELMSDEVLNPAFPPGEFARYQKRQLAQLEQERSEPDFLALERFRKVLFGDFAASIVSATPASIKAMTTAQLKHFHDRYYVPNNAILGVAGDIQYEEVVPLIEKAFGGWEGHPIHSARLGAIAPPAPAKITLVDRPGSAQINIVAGGFGVRRTDPDFIPLTVMNRVLGGGPSARLYLNLSEKHGYTYGAYSSISSGIYPGSWRASTEVRNAVTDASLHELMEEFKRIRTQQVPESELDEARRSIVAGFALSLEHPVKLLGFWMTASYYHLPQDYWDRYPEEVARVSPPVVEQMAKKYVDLDHLQFVCVGDGKVIRDTLEKYGPVEVYDVDGKRLE